MIKTPVVLLVFNRLETTREVFEAVRKVQPAQLFVVADGPREGNSGEALQCQKVRGLIDSIDWECQVHTNYSDVNLGCKERVSSGLDWVFDQVEEAIILEDDCVPDVSFFQFCEELLERYRYDARVMAIAGDNFQFGRRRTQYSYYFSRYPHCWGWATWRRAWRYYDGEMKLWPAIRDGNWLQDILGHRMAAQTFRQSFQQVYEGKINSWAYRWTLACWIQNGLTILPQVNLVKNIGFSQAATHTKNTKSPFADIPIASIHFPLNHPPFIVCDAQADKFTYHTMFSQFTKARRRILNLLRI